MAYTFDNTLRTARADAITSRLTTGSKLQIYTAAYGTKLIEYTWTGSVWAGATTGVLSPMNAPATNPMTPAANGTAAIARHTLADGTTAVINDLTVGTSGANVNLTNLTVVTTSPVTLSTYAITEAA